MAVDPGTTTGVARGTFVPVKGGDLAAHFAFGLYESWEVEGIPGEQAWEIIGEFVDWRADLILKHNYRPEAISLTFESFQLRIDKARGAGSSKPMLDPIRVISACEALCFNSRGERIVDFGFQSPSDKSTITNDRLRRWGLWVVGSEHRRDAMRHLALRVDSQIT